MAYTTANLSSSHSIPNPLVYSSVRVCTSYLYIHIRTVWCTQWNLSTVVLHVTVWHCIE